MPSPFAWGMRDSGTVGVDFVLLRRLCRTVTMWHWCMGETSSKMMCGGSQYYYATLVLTPRRSRVRVCANTWPAILKASCLSCHSIGLLYSFTYYSYM